MVRKNWDITQDYRLEQVSDCILRGVTKVERSETQKPSNITAPLTDENMPAHMHNSGITQGASMEGLKSDGAAKVGSAKGTTVDLFDNDSFSTGVDCNELEGVVDGFSVVKQGNDSIQHDNLPKVKRYYTFVVTKVS